MHATPVPEKNIFIRFGTTLFEILSATAICYTTGIRWTKRCNEAAKHYLGSRDFTSFCTLDSRDKGDLTRTVTRSEVTRQGDLVTFTVAADGFLYNMVRIMVGTLLRVAQGKFSPEDLPRILEAKDRAAAGPTAPPWGLYLNRVFYGGESNER